MNRWTRVGILGGAMQFVGASVGGCVTGDIPPQQTNTPEGGSTSPGSGAGGQGAGTGDDGGNGASSGSGGASSGSGGSSGASSSGNGGTGGSAGATSSGGNDADGGRSSDGSAPAADAGTGTNNGCGALSQACCSNPPDSCGTNLTCLLGASCSCVKGIFGSYIIRVDGIALQQPTSATGAQTAILDAATAQPSTGFVAGADFGTAACALRDDGTVWCWRATTNGNAAGTLGNGSIDTNGPIFRATEVLVAANTPLTNVKSIDPISSCAVTNDGKLYCWGDLTWSVNGGAALHSGYAQPITTDGATPLTAVLQASGAGWSPCALVAGAASNEVWCWGSNVNYNLGTGDNINRQYPTKIVGLTNPTKVVANWGVNSNGGVWAAHCAIDGANVLCWGHNGDGETGIGNSNTPVRVPTLVKLSDGTTPFTGALDLYAGAFRTCALRTGNTLWCWGAGYNTYATNLGLTNVVAAGSGETRQYLTSDGLYHNGTVTIAPMCGALQ